MPLYDLTCNECDPPYRFEALVKREELDAGQVACPQCGDNRLQLGFAAIGGYHIKGDNSASVRPKNAGSKGSK